MYKIILGLLLSCSALAHDMPKFKHHDLVSMKPGFTGYSYVSYFMRCDEVRIFKVDSVRDEGEKEGWSYRIISTDVGTEICPDPIWEFESDLVKVINDEGN